MIKIKRFSELHNDLKNRQEMMDGGKRISKCIIEMNDQVLQENGI